MRTGNFEESITKGDHEKSFLFSGLFSLLYYFALSRTRPQVFCSLREAQILIKQWRKHDNTKRPHSALGYRPPAPETIIAMEAKPIMHQHSKCTTQVGLIISGDPGIPLKSPLLNTEMSRFNHYL